MTQKNPYVIKAELLCVNYNFYNEMYEIEAFDQNSNRQLFYVSKKNMPNNYGNKKNLTLWFAKSGFVAYVAFGDYVVKTMYDADNAILDQVTAHHLGNYERKAEARLATKKRLDEIQRQIALIDLINAESVQNVEQAKKTLIDFLKTKAENIRQSVSKHR